jgi:hypothetical protein
MYFYIKHITLDGTIIYLTSNSVTDQNVSHCDTSQNSKFHAAELDS